MKYAARSLTLCTLSLVSSAYTGEYDVDSHWDILTEYVFMERSKIDDRKLVKNEADLHCDHGCPSTVVLSAKDLVNAFNWQSGARVGVAYIPDTKSIYEARFLYTWPWSSTKTEYGDNTLSFPFHSDTFTEDYNTAYEARAYYKTHFYTFDLNYWRNSARRGIDYFVVSGVFGLRYFHIQEKSTLAFFNHTVNGNTKSNYNAKTRNDVIGIQGGFNFQMNPFMHFHFDLLGVAGLGLNRAYESIFLGDVNNTVTIRDFTKQHSEDVVFTDVEAKIGYQVLPYMNIHAGYQMFFASGLALAPEEYSYSTDATSERFVRKGNVIIHGILVGFNFDF